MLETKEEEQEIGNLFEKNDEGKLPQSGKGNRLPEVQEAQRVPKKLDPRRNTPRHIIITLPKVKDREKILEAAREKDSCLQRSTHKAMLISQRKPCRQEGAEKKY